MKKKSLFREQNKEQKAAILDMMLEASAAADTIQDKQSIIKARKELVAESVGLIHLSLINESDEVLSDVRKIKAAVNNSILTKLISQKKRISKILPDKPEMDKQNKLERLISFLKS